MSRPLQSAESAIAEFMRDKLPEGAELAPDLDIIDQRLVDSLSFMNFVFLIEELIGEPIPVETINIDDFRTMRRIREKFLAKLA